MSRIQMGSTACLSVLADCDLVIEAVAEQLTVKRDLYRALRAVCKPDTIVSSNTSTIPISALTGDQPEAFSRNFLSTHFFNPPRKMRLLELVSGPATAREAVQCITEFADVRLGKSVVPAKDTPGFIANRIGTYWMVAAEREAYRST